MVVFKMKGGGRVGLGAAWESWTVMFLPPDLITVRRIPDRIHKSRTTSSQVCQLFPALGEAVTEDLNELLNNEAQQKL